MMTDFIFLGSKITADGDCSHEIKRRLLLERKAMTNLDSVLKSRDITLPTKICLVKVMVFPVIMYGCKSWTIRSDQSLSRVRLFATPWIAAHQGSLSITIKKAECWRIDAFKLWCWRRLLRVPWIARISNQSILKKTTVLNIHWKDWCWNWSSNTLASWCKELTH